MRSHGHTRHRVPVPGGQRPSWIDSLAGLTPAQLALLDVWPDGSAIEVRSAIRFHHSPPVRSQVAINVPYCSVSRNPRHKHASSCKSRYRNVKACWARVCNDKSQPSVITSILGSNDRRGVNVRYGRHEAGGLATAARCCRASQGPEALSFAHNFPGVNFRAGRSFCHRRSIITISMEKLTSGEVSADLDAAQKHLQLIPSSGYGQPAWLQVTLASEESAEHGDAAQKTALGA